MAPSCRYECRFCPDTGLKATDTSLSQQEHIRRAKAGGYDRVALSCSSLFEPGLADLIKELRTEGWPVVIRVSEQFQLSDFSHLSHLVDPNEVELEWIFSHWDATQQELIWRIEETWTIHQFTWMVNRVQGLLATFEGFPRQYWDRLRFCFPYKRNENDGHYSAGEVARVLEDLGLRYPELEIKSPEHYEIFHPEIFPDSDLDPIIEPAIRLRSSQGPPRVSYVLPTFNNAPHLLTTLRNIVSQNSDGKQYEIIVVDDGSTDGTHQKLEKWLFKQKIRCGFTYIYFPRPQRRKMGDVQFRAGIARNLGVKWSSGDILCFLDSDILISPNYTNHLIEQHEEFDIIQPKRFQLKKTFSSGKFLHQHLTIEDHTKAKKNGYWEVFQSCTEDWNKMLLRWRYVSTFCLSIKTEHFKSLGWFRRTFAGYGFEDTDLGFRAHKAGLKFLLSQEKVYHLHHPLLRSEYFHSAFFKDLLLSRSIRTFFLNNLDLEIFRALELYFSSDMLKQKWKDKIRGRLQFESTRRWNQYLLGREES